MQLLSYAQQHCVNSATCLVKGSEGSQTDSYAGWGLPRGSPGVAGWAESCILETIYRSYSPAPFPMLHIQTWFLHIGVRSKHDSVSEEIKLFLKTYCRDELKAMVGRVLGLNPGTWGCLSTVPWLFPDQPDGKNHSVGFGICMSDHIRGSGENVLLGGCMLGTRKNKNLFALRLEWLL